MQLYVQAVMSSDDFDKDVFDMEHFVVCQASAHNVNHNTYHGHASQKKLRCLSVFSLMFQSSRIFAEPLMCSVACKAAYMQHQLCICNM